MNRLCRRILDYVGCHTASSGGYWRYFYSDTETTAQCELFLTVWNRNIFTYLNLHKWSMRQVYETCNLGVRFKVKVRFKVTGGRR